MVMVTVSVPLAFEQKNCVSAGAVWLAASSRYRFRVESARPSPAAQPAQSPPESRSTPPPPRAAEQSSECSHPAVTTASSQPAAHRAQRGAIRGRKLGLRGAGGRLAGCRRQQHRNKPRASNRGASSRTFPVILSAQQDSHFERPWATVSLVQWSGNEFVLRPARNAVARSFDALGQQGSFISNWIARAGRDRPAQVRGAEFNANCHSCTIPHRAKHAPAAAFPASRRFSLLQSSSPPLQLAQQSPQLAAQPTAAHKPISRAQPTCQGSLRPRRPPQRRWPVAPPAPSLPTGPSTTSPPRPPSSGIARACASTPPTPA